MRVPVRPRLGLQTLNDMSTLWMILFGAFLCAADYTVQNNQIPKLNWRPDVRMERNIIYYDVIDSVGIDGIRTFNQDSIVYYDRVRGKNK